MFLNHLEVEDTEEGSILLTPTNILTITLTGRVSLRQEQAEQQSRDLPDLPSQGPDSAPIVSAYFFGIRRISECKRILVFWVFRIVIFRGVYFGNSPSAQRLSLELFVIVIKWKRIYVALIFDGKERKERVCMNWIDTSCLEEEAFTQLFNLPKFLVRNIVWDLYVNNIKINNACA